jgi:integrase/recombinase XerC
VQHSYVPIVHWLDWYAASGASAGTIRVRKSHLLRLAHRVNVLAAREQDLVSFLAAHANLKPESRKSLQASLRSFYKWALARGLIHVDPTVGLRDVVSPGGVPRPITEAALRSALLAADREQTLMLMLGAYAGLRRMEIAAVHSDHVEGAVLRVEGKGRKVRRVPVHPRLAEHLDPVRGWAFPSPVREGRPVTPDYVSDRLGRILPRPYGPHSLRHRFATQAYRNTHDIRAVQQLLGHARPETTARYTLCDDDALTAAVLSVA